MLKNSFNIAFFASHNGSNMQKIIDAYKNSIIKSRPSLVISNNSKAFALERAKKEKIPNVHISYKNLLGKENEEKAILYVLDYYKIDLIVLAGYMKKIGSEILEEYKNRIINIHPSLLPKYGGKGMYGMSVHKAVFESNDKESGATVHFVDQNYDEGKIILQQKVNIENYHSAEEISKAVLEIEHKIYIQAIKKLENI